MKLEIEMDETTDSSKQLIDFLNNQKINYTTKTLTAHNVAFGIGRKATDEELANYLVRCMESETFELNDLMNESKD